MRVDLPCTSFYALSPVSISSLWFLFGPPLSHTLRVWNNRDAKMSERYWLRGETNLDWAGLRKHRGSKRQGQGWKTHLQPRGCSSEEEQLVPFWVRSARFSLLFLFFSVHHIYLDWDAVSAFRSQFHFCVLPQVHHFLCRCSFSVNKRLLPVGFWAGLSGQGNQCSPWFCLDVFCCFFGTSEMIVAYDSDSRVSILLFKGFRE